MAAGNSFYIQYKLRAVIVFAVALAILLVRFFSHSLLPQMDTSIPVLFQQKEVFYQWFYSTGITQYIVHHYIVAATFDVCLFFSGFFFLILRERIFAIVFWLLTLIYFFSFNVITGHHYHGLIGVLIIVLPFFSKEGKRFDIAWEGVRYYLLYIFASAALWKIARGSAFNVEQLSSILKAQQLDLLLQNPDSLRASISAYLISHSSVGHAILLVNVLVQLSFALGFFTKRFDTALLILSIVFVVANYFVMSIVSWELLILSLTLLNWDRVEVLWQKYMPSKLQFSYAAP